MPSKEARILVGGFSGISGEIIERHRRQGRLTGHVLIRADRVPQGWPIDRNELWYLQGEYELAPEFVDV